MNATTESSQPDHEDKDVDVTSLFTIVLTLFVSCAVIFLVVTIMIRSFSREEPIKTAGQANLPATHSEEFSGPRLEVKPGASLAELRAAEAADLNSYGWIDRTSGRIRIPIDRAMRLILERGLPDVGSGKTPLALMQARPVETASPPQSPSKP